MLIGEFKSYITNKKTEVYKYKDKIVTYTPFIEIKPETKKELQQEKVESKRSIFWS